MDTKRERGRGRERERERVQGRPVESVKDVITKGSIEILPQNTVALV